MWQSKYLKDNKLSLPASYGRHRRVPSCGVNHRSFAHYVNVVLVVLAKYADKLLAVETLDFLFCFVKILLFNYRRVENLWENIIPHDSYSSSYAVVETDIYLTHSTSMNLVSFRLTKVMPYPCLMYSVMKALAVSKALYATQQQ